MVPAADPDGPIPLSVPGRRRRRFCAIRHDGTGDRGAGSGRECHDAFREYLEHGGKVDSYTLQDFDATQRELVSLLKEASPSTPAKFLLAARKAGEWIDRVNGTVETATRLSAYVEARRSGMTPARAAYLAKNLTVNFNDHGRYGSVVNALYMFTNASVQGSARMVQAMSGPTGRKIALAIGLCRAKRTRLPSRSI